MRRSDMTGFAEKMLEYPLFYRLFKCLFSQFLTSYHKSEAQEKSKPHRNP